MKPVPRDNSLSPGKSSINRISDIDLEEIKLIISINKSLKFIKGSVHPFVIDGMKSIRSKEAE